MSPTLEPHVLERARENVCANCGHNTKLDECGYMFSYGAIVYCQHCHPRIWQGIKMPKPKRHDYRDSMFDENGMLCGKCVNDCKGL